MLKKSLILIACLSGCSNSPPECKNWSSAEKQAMKQADIQLPKNNALHPLVRDYEAICVEQPMKFGPFTL